MIIKYVGYIFVVLGLISLYKRASNIKFYKKITKGQSTEYEKTVGVVVCCAYHISDSTKLTKPVTPIVEYEVNGEKYETQNSVLSNDLELPAGVKMNVWYKKDEPRISFLETELYNYYSNSILGTTLIFFGLLFILM